MFQVASQLLPKADIVPRKTRRVARFSKEVVSGFASPETDRVEWWDSECPNLVCRVSSAGTKTFCWIGRDGMAFKRIKLGVFPTMVVAAARDEAKRLTGLAVQGKPVRSLPQEARGEWTLQELFDWYLETHSKPHKRTWKRDERQFDVRFKQWGARRVSSISRAEVQLLHLAVGKADGPYAGNKCLELLGHMYRLGAASDRSRVPCEDPTQGIKRFPRDERERFLDSEELPKFLDAVEKLPRETTRDFFKLCLWTGARRSNVASMRWEDISIETGVWTIPREQSKSKRPMNIALSLQALDILIRRKKDASGPWVLPGQSPTGHFTSPRDAMRQILEISGLRDVRVHDLRRTLGSWMAIDNPLQVVGKQLGHQSLKSTAIYARLATQTLKEAVGKATAAMDQASKKVKSKKVK